MKKLALVLSAALLAGLVFLPVAVAGDAKAAGKTHEVTAEIVSVDAKALTITIKKPDGENMTATVLEEARAGLKDLKAGDTVTLTCKDNDKGEHVGVSAIRKAS